MSDHLTRENGRLRTANAELYRIVENYEEALSDISEGVGDPEGVAREVLYVVDKGWTSIVERLAQHDDTSKADLFDGDPEDAEL